MGSNEGLDKPSLHAGHQSTSR